LASHSPNLSSSSTFSNHHYFIHRNCLYPKVSLPICRSFSKLSLLNLSLPIRTLLCRLSLPIQTLLYHLSPPIHTLIFHLFFLLHTLVLHLSLSASSSLHSSSHLSLILHTILSHQPICNLSFSICLSSPHSCFLSVSPLHTFVFHLSHPVLFFLSTLFFIICLIFSPHSFSLSLFFHALLSHLSLLLHPHFSFPSVTLPDKLSICLFLSILSFSVCLSFSLNSCFSSVSSSSPSLYRVFLFPHCPSLCFYFIKTPLTISVFFRHA